MQKESIDISNHPVLLAAQQQFYDYVLRSRFDDILKTNSYSYDPRCREEPKPSYSYIGLIAMAILSTPARQLVLSDIYRWILDHYAYFRTRGTGWRNSIRHNLSLNDCFVKTSRSANGKGHYWTIHPANLADFISGDFRRRRAQRRVRKSMGINAPDDEEDDDDDIIVTEHHTNEDLHPSSTNSPIITPNLLHDYFAISKLEAPQRKRCFNVDSLLAPEQPCSIKRQKHIYNSYASTETDISA